MDGRASSVVECGTDHVSPATTTYSPRFPSLKADMKACYYNTMSTLQT